MTRVTTSLGLSALALAMFAGSAAADEGSARYIVKYQAGQGAAVQAAVAAQQGQVMRELSARHAISVSLPQGRADALARHPHVEFLEEDVKRFPMAETTPYGVIQVQGDQLGLNASAPTKVCIIDSGYDLAHEDLLSAGVDGTNDSGTGNWFTDENGHGTHVAGTIAAASNNGIGVVGVVSDPGLNLHIIKVFGADGWAYSSGLVAALDACKAARGANENLVINMSLGGSRKSRFEEQAFAQADSEGILSVAAAGNDGTTRDSFPASYGSVVSVAAIDEQKQIASFSQQNAQVEFSGPGVAVLSTVPMGTASVASLTANNTDYAAEGMEDSPSGSASGEMVDCGLGESACAAAGGKVCLISRGNISFADKVLNCQAGGGSAAVIFNNEPGMLYGTLGGVATNIPSVGISDVDGATLLQALSSGVVNASVDVGAGNYAYFNGTSMATPHVVAVAALVWSNHSSCSNVDIRNALAATAEDLGATGRDNAYGYGLVQAKLASDYLTTYGCAGDGSNGGDGGNGGGGGGGKGKPKRL
ncbi:S8 family serine peptidase [Ferrimonas gelatinilytica]|uniref:Peptidase S8 n=1 Tax=Ferrimonas gelatinilytica TaxID=1255257 RepID=A0ABP9S501_9GAMM